MSSSVRALIDSCRRPVYLRGIFHARLATTAAQGALELDLAVGTTDVEAVNGEFGWMFKAHNILHCSHPLLDMMSDELFSRVFFRRTNCHNMPAIAHGSNILAQSLTYARALSLAQHTAGWVRMLEAWDAYWLAGGTVSDDVVAEGQRRASEARFCTA